MSREFADALRGVRTPSLRQRIAERANSWCRRHLRAWIDDGSLRTQWFEFNPGFGLTLAYSVYHEKATINLCLGWGKLYIHVPMVITQRPGTEDWNASYGITYFGNSFHLNWRTRCKIIHMPWEWSHLRHDYLNADGTLNHRSGPSDYTPPPETCEQHPYTYVLKNGTVQRRIATINGEEREWRWRAFMWLAYPRMIQRSINVRFDDEVGERSGSWKGGTVGCGSEWRKGETLEQALRRMELERKF